MPAGSDPWSDPYSYGARRRRAVVRTCDHRSEDHRRCGASAVVSTGSVHFCAAHDAAALAQAAARLAGGPSKYDPKPCAHCKRKETVDFDSPFAPFCSEVCGEAAR